MRVESSSDMDMDTDATVTIGGGDRPLATEMTLRVPDPIRTEMNSVTQMAITEPIETKSDMRVDVQPVVVDLCVTANIGKVPRLCIRRPYNHHLGFTVMGVEVLGVNLVGERSTIVDDLPPRPAVAFGGEQHIDHRPRGSDGPVRLRPEASPDAPPAGVAPDGPGIRIRLGP